MLDKARRPGSPQPEPGPAVSRRGPGALSRSWNRVVRPVAGAVPRRRKEPADPAPPRHDRTSRPPARETEAALAPVAVGVAAPPVGGEPPDPTAAGAVAEPLADRDEDPTSPLQRAAATGGGLVLSPGWRERDRSARHRPAGARVRTAYRWSERRLAELWRRRPTSAEVRARQPSRQQIADTARRHRFLLGGLALTMLLAGGDSATEILVTEQAPAPGLAHRVAVAYPLRLSTPVPSVRRYLDAIDHGERLREQAVVAAAARATLDRARREAAAAVAGQEQPWINSRPAPEGGAIPPGMIPPSAGGFVLPAPGTFTSGFGSRWGTFHRGIDVAAPIGTPIYAVADGTVVDAGPAQGFGLWVRIRHDDGTVSVYGHMYDFFVSVGERVPAGMQIARMGNRGDSSGPHLHFEIIMDGQHVDPQRWLGLHGLSYG